MQLKHSGHFSLSLARHICVELARGSDGVRRPRGTQRGRHPPPVNHFCVTTAMRWCIHWHVANCIPLCAADAFLRGSKATAAVPPPLASTTFVRNLSDDPYGCHCCCAFNHDSSMLPDEGKEGRRVAVRILVMYRVRRGDFTLKDSWSV